MIVFSLHIEIICRKSFTMVLISDVKNPLQNSQNFASKRTMDRKAGRNRWSLCNQVSISEILPSEMEMEMEISSLDQAWLD